MAKPWSSSIKANARSIPAVMPAEVHTLPARQKMRSASTRMDGYSRCVLVQRELESRSCPNWFGRGEATHLPPLGATDAGGLEFAIACLPDLSVPAGQAIL